MSAKNKLLDQIIRPVVEGLGYEFWGLEYLSQGKHTTLRLFIERPITENDDDQNGPEKESGIELKDCEIVSRQLSGVLDVEDPITGDYTLEVSSPGLDRPLYALAHYERFKGQHVALKLRMPFEGRRKFSGVLAGVEGSDIVLQVEQEEFLFPFEGIEKANVVPQFD